MGVRYSKHITHGPRWKYLRQLALRRDGFQCVQCGARGRLEVDHIQPVRSHPELAWELDNLQCLCPGCHARKTRIECGHAPSDPDRERWRAAVDDLMPVNTPVVRRANPLDGDFSNAGIRKDPTPPVGDPTAIGNLGRKD
ncbi:MAG: HNH endonuclease signature motif containing protein [Pseudomonadota bacterium]